MCKHKRFSVEFILRGLLLGILICIAFVLNSAALAEERRLNITAQLDEGEDRMPEYYAAAHRLLGVSTQNNEAMMEINEDYCGWLEQSDTPIDYPIAQGTDNQYYLTNSFKGESSKSGCLFLDCRNGEYFCDANSIVYGHHMKDDSMLATIVGFKKQSYYDKHPTFNLYTPYGDYTVEVFAATIVDGKYDFLQRNFDNDETFQTYWKQFKEGTAFDSDIEVERGNRIISLVTCTYEYDNARYIVCGKLTPVEIWEDDIAEAE